MKNLLFKILWKSWLYIHHDVYGYSTDYWWIGAKHLTPKNYDWITPCESGDKDAWNYHTYHNRRLDYKIRRKLHLCCKANHNKIYNGRWQNMCHGYESFIRWLECKLHYR
tara:strand:+ start:283 stop:612 length:330 start_codon:yes stop_codon:yes gene_type:complete